jgi:hypothetical protein
MHVHNEVLMRVNPLDDSLFVFREHFSLQEVI